MWLAHIVLFSPAENSHLELVARFLRPCLLTLTHERLLSILTVGLTYKKVEGSRIQIIEGAVRLQRRTALLTIHLARVIQHLPVYLHKLECTQYARKSSQYLIVRSQLTAIPT